MSIVLAKPAPHGQVIGTSMRSGRAVHLLQRDSLPCFRNGFSCVQPKHAEEFNLNLEDRRLKLAIILARELIGTPRHLSQHSGGFVLTHNRLDELVPIEPAAMPDRQVIEWDKDDIDR